MATAMFPNTVRQAQRWYAFVFIVAMVAPIIVVLPLGFSSGSFLSYPLPGLSLRWFEKVFQPEPWMHALFNSVTIGLATAAVATVLGTLAALGLSRKQTAGAPIFLVLILLPMIIPSIVYAVSVYFFFATLGLNETFLGMVIAHSTLALPFVVIPVLSTLSNFDRKLILAGESLGASPVQVFWNVTLPNIAPGVMTGAIFAFATSFDEVIVAIFVAGPEQKTLPRQMIDGIRDSIDPSIISVSFLLFLFACLLLVSSVLLAKRS